MLIFRTIREISSLILAGILYVYYFWFPVTQPQDFQGNLDTQWWVFMGLMLYLSMQAGLVFASTKAGWWRVAMDIFLSLTPIVVVAVALIKANDGTITLSHFHAHQLSWFVCVICVYDTVVHTSFGLLINQLQDIRQTTITGTIPAS